MISLRQSYRIAYDLGQINTKITTTHIFLNYYKQIEYKRCLEALNDIKILIEYKQKLIVDCDELLSLWNDVYNNLIYFQKMDNKEGK